MRLWDGYNYIDKEIRGALSGSVALCWYAAADQQSKLHECDLDSGTGSKSMKTARLAHSSYAAVLERAVSGA
jgi:uncharacterized protein YfaA (DUF2138 family)